MSPIWILKQKVEWESFLVEVGYLIILFNKLHCSQFLSSSAMVLRIFPRIEDYQVVDLRHWGKHSTTYFLVFDQVVVNWVRDWNWDF